MPAAPPSAPAPASPAVVGGWSIQVGAFRTVEPARGAIDQARDAAPDLLAHAVAATPDVETPNGRFVRARLVGLSPEAARAACRLVERRGQGCFTVAPPARS
ncbi:MAG: SPOR domain-containing protein [Elioraea tepidiphila]